MRVRNLLLIGALALTSQSNAQNWVQDSVVMGPGYTNDVHYSLKNGAHAPVANNNWHIAFQMTPQGPYGNASVFANHVQGGVNVYSLHKKASSNFTSISTADTIGLMNAGNQFFNSDTSWNFGAFNMNKNAADPTDYGWGIYHQTPNHDVDGDSVFLVTVATSSTTFDAYKLWVQTYHSYPLDSTYWKFRIAKLDGTGDTTLKIYRSPNYTSRLFVYYNAATQSFIDREPNRPEWDLLFTRYKEYLPGAPGVPYYSVMGVLSNFEVTVAEQYPLLANDTAGYKSFTYATAMNTIGSDWKSFDMTQSPPAWVLKDSSYYFIKTKHTNEYYQVKFTGFGGSASGKVIFSKRLLGMIASIGSVPTSVNAFFVAPNPAQNDASIVIDSKENNPNVSVSVVDFNGRIVMTANHNFNAGLNAVNIATSTLTSGTYVVILSNGAWKMTEKLMVQH